MFYLCYLYVFTDTDVHHDFHIKWCLCRLTVTRRLSLVKEQLLILLEHMSSLAGFSGIRFARSIVF
jgi:hypothetical protein